MLKLSLVDPVIPAPQYRKQETVGIEHQLEQPFLTKIYMKYRVNA